MKFELNGLEQECQDKRNDLKRAEQAIVRHQRELKILHMDIQRAETVVEDLQDALDRDAIEEGKLELLKKYQKELEEEKTVCHASYQESVIASDKHKAAMRTSKGEMTKLDANIQEIDARILKAESKALNASTQRQRALAEKNAALELLPELANQKTVLEEQLAAKVERVKDFNEKANQICPRVSIDEGATTESLERKLEKLNSDLRTFEAR